MLLWFANIAGFCFDFFKNLGIHDYKWLWLVLFYWKDHSNPLCKLHGLLRDCWIIIRECCSTECVVFSSIVSCSQSVLLMLLVLTLLTLVSCLCLLTWYLFSTGGKSGGNKKNDGVKVSPPHFWILQDDKYAWMSFLVVGPSVAQIFCFMCYSIFRHIFPILVFCTKNKTEGEKNIVCKAQIQ